MLDIKYIRDNTETVKKAMAARNFKAAVIDELIDLDKNRREFQTQLEEMRGRKNKFNRGIAKLSEQEKKEKIVDMTKLVKDEAKIEEQLTATIETFDKLMFDVPNIPQPDVPIGRDSSKNEVVKTVGDPTTFDFKIKNHVELGEELNLIDTKTAAKVSGSRFAYLKNEVVLLEFALIRYAFDTLIKEGFTPVLPPMLIKEEMMQGLGYLGGQGEADTYHFERDKMYFTGTAEHALIPMHANEILEEKTLPRRYIGFSSAFRREAGSYGKDTKGILRVHQFDKVEMVSFARPEDSEKEHEFLLSMSEKLVQLLELPYRVVKLCTGDMANPSAKTYDIECWLPSEKTYRETHSISNCTDYQARRLKIRYKASGGSNHFVHTLNGTAFAIGRALIMILENYQQKDGSVAVPAVLQKYLPGIPVIGPKK